MINLKERISNVFTTNISDKTSKIYLPTNYEDIKIVDNKCFYYAHFDECIIGPIPITDYKIEGDQIIFDKLINKPPQIRAKGKLRKKTQSTSAKGEYMVLGSGPDGNIIIGPVYTLPMDKGIYKGQIEKNVPHGIGVYISETEIYYGPYVNGKRTGLGIAKYTNKLRHIETRIVQCQDKEYYVGEFLNNYRHGTGTLTCLIKDSPFKKCWGTWVEDRLEGPNCVIEYTDGETYVGPITNNVHNGYGMMSYPDGSIEKGWWKTGHRHGTTTCIKPDTSIIRQNWILGMPGRHKITFSDK